MPNIGFQATIVMLLRECFEGKEPASSYTWFVEGREGLFDALDSVSADRASMPPAPDCSSIAGHAYHALYALRGVNSMHGGKAPVGGWEGSWKKQAASDEEWSELRAAIRSEYASFMQWIRNHEDWSDDATLSAAVATLPHMAFHLGAIRQLMPLTSN